MQFIDTKQAAKMLNIPPALLREKAKSRELPAYKIGKYWRFDPIELEYFIKYGRFSLEQEGDDKEKLCQNNLSASQKEAVTGTTPLHRREVEKEYEEVLRLITKP